MEKKAYVILLHGLARTHYSMQPLARVLSKQGYQVVNVGYPSRHAVIATLAIQAINKGLSQCTADQPIHFVTHSLGGILLRFYLKNHKINQLGRVVMLGPPNQGSEVVDQLKQIPGFRAFNGPAGLQLGTDQNSIPKNLGAVDFPLGIIAGNRSVNYLLSMLLPDPNDGKVSVASTKLTGMSDHIVMPCTHTFMMNNKRVIQQVMNFLEHGVFIHEK